MKKNFITGSSDGLGFLAAKALLAKGCQVVLHARNAERRNQTLQKISGVDVVVGDLSNIEETIKLAEAVNAFGAFDTVIHNAGVYNASSKDIFAVNVLAPYILTCRMYRPKKLIYLSSDMHLQGQIKLHNLENNLQEINYSDSKLFVLMLCKAIARNWRGVESNAVDPGWVPTKMGGSQASDSLEKGIETQIWLALRRNKDVGLSGHYWNHKKKARFHISADDIDLQERLITMCEKYTGCKFAHF